MSPTLCRTALLTAAAVSVSFRPLFPTPMTSMTQRMCEAYARTCSYKGAESLRPQSRCTIWCGSSPWHSHTCNDDSEKLTLCSASSGLDDELVRVDDFEVTLDSSLEQVPTIDRASHSTLHPD